MGKKHVPAQSSRVADSEQGAVVEKVRGPYFERRLSALLTALKTTPATELPPSEKYLAVYLFVRDGADGKFSLEGPDHNIMAGFIDHLLSGIVRDPGYLPAADHKSGLRHDAMLLQASRTPISSLILYATWIEHWLNGVIRTSLKRRSVETVSRDVTRQVALAGKVTWLFLLLGLPPLEDEYRKAIVQLTSLRNEYVHYKWEGPSSATWGNTDDRIHEVLAGSDSLLRYLVGYAVENLYEPAMTIGERLFRYEYREWPVLFS